MARQLASTATKVVQKEDNVHDFNLTYNIEHENGTVKSLNCSGIQTSGTGNCFVTWQRGVAYPSISFNQCVAVPELQTHINEAFAEIVGEIETD